MRWSVMSYNLLGGTLVIVITGATGHIGNVLVRKLAAKGRKIRAIVPAFEDTIPIDNLNIEIVEGDVRDYRSLLEAFDGCEYVYHLAGIISITSREDELLHDVNVIGTKNVVKACLKSGIKRLVYTSSIHAFEEPPHGTPIVETKDFNPLKVPGGYAKSKAAATNEVFAGIKKGLDAVIVHPTGVIGPYEYRLSNTGQLIYDFLHKRLLAYIDGAYDFVDVRDVAKGLMLALEKGKKGENYILSGEQITVKEILKILETQTGIKSPRIKMPIWFAKAISPLFEKYYEIKNQQPLFTSYSITTLQSNSLTTHDKASKELGYTARPIRDTIRDTVKWIKENMS